MATVGNKNNGKNDYFQLQVWIFIMPPILYTFGVAIYAPDWLIWNQGPLSQLATYCATHHPYWTQLIFEGIVKLHVFVCFVVGYLCWKTNLNASSTIKWLLQTPVAGTCCMVAMLEYLHNQRKLRQKTK